MFSRSQCSGHSGYKSEKYLPGQSIESLMLRKCARMLYKTAVFNEQSFDIFGIVSIGKVRIHFYLIYILNIIKIYIRIPMENK